jgi:tripartite-type tricarboxylate transporter receptor subunit TctC
MKASTLMKTCFTVAKRWLPIVALATSGFAHAQAWPTKPVRLVVPFTPGGTTDILARVLSDALTTGLGQPVVVDSKPGAAGAIGSQEVARAPADGYTLLVATSTTHSVAPAVSKTLRYNPVEDFTPIALIGEANTMLLTSAKSEAKNLKEFIALAKQKPGMYNYASSGIGSFGQLTFELLASQAGIKITHVPYKGISASFPDVVAGSVHLTVDAVPSAVPHTKEGRMRALAVTGSQRSSLAPDVPTVAESGVPNYSVALWVGLYAPRGLSPVLTKQINEAVNKALSGADVAARLTSMGIEAGRGTSAQFASMVADDTARWTRLAKDLKIELD